MDRFNIALPLIGYLLFVFFAALWASRRMAKPSDRSSVLEEYFIGGRDLGGFVLAMTIMASYTSASSFIGGPGVAYTVGLAWVLLAMIQVPTTFLTLGVLGKRFAAIGKSIHAITITDFLYKRYKSDTVVVLCSLALIVFFMASMLAQFIGGARIFQSVTGFSYESGLIIFGGAVILYTAVGGFRAVALTDAVQGIVMIAASVVMLAAVVKAGGGFGACFETLKAIDPNLITPKGAGNSVPAPQLFSFWILVGLGILGLPQTTQKCFGYSDSRSMHNAMIYGTLIVGLPLLCMHLAGTLGRAVIPDLSSGDLIVPTVITTLLPPFWAGVFIAGPIAAIMSTVDSMLLLVSAAVIKDLYVRYALHGNTRKMDSSRIGRMSLACTLAVGLLVCVSALKPPSLLVWINLFAFGGLEAVFLWPIILGMYSKKANSAGAVCSILAGLASFIFFTAAGGLPYKINAIVPSLLISLAAFLIGNCFGKKPDSETVRFFWGYDSV